jgi:hypothetical protein
MSCSKSFVARARICSIESIHKVENAGIFLLLQLRWGGGIPLPPQVVARGFDDAKPSTAGKWRFKNGHQSSEKSKSQARHQPPPCPIGDLLKGLGSIQRLKMGLCKG